IARHARRASRRQADARRIAAWSRSAARNVRAPHARPEPNPAPGRSPLLPSRAQRSARARPERLNTKKREGDSVTRAAFVEAACRWWTPRGRPKLFQPVTDLRSLLRDCGITVRMWIPSEAREFAFHRPCCDGGVVSSRQLIGAHGTSDAFCRR